jgi:hypothetical protein
LESVGAPCIGAGTLRPYKAEHVLEQAPGVLPRARMLRARPSENRAARDEHRIINNLWTGNGTRGQS